MLKLQSNSCAKEFASILSAQLYYQNRYLLSNIIRSPIFMHCVDKLHLKYHNSAGSLQVRVHALGYSDFDNIILFPKKHVL